MTFTDYATTWVATREIKPKTREGYEHVLDKYLLPWFTTRPIADITPAEVRTWWTSMNPDTPTVRARSYALLKAVLNTAVADDLIDANPCRIRGASNSPRARDVRPRHHGDARPVRPRLLAEARTAGAKTAGCLQTRVRSHSARTHSSPRPTLGRPRVRPDLRPRLRHPRAGT